MNQPKASPLFKAVSKNDRATLKKLLDAGEAVEVQDHERMTPLLRAAEAGHHEAFHLLVDAGANLHAVGMGPTDALEMAASGGNVEIIRFLIDRGLPIEGRWNPRSPELRRMGHMTPLICAAIEGNVEAVQMLLEAGADREAKFDGQTALKMVKSEIKFPLYAKNAEDTENYKSIALLLEGKPAKGKPASVSEDQDPIKKEVADFASNASKAGYLRLRKSLEACCGKPKSWKPVPDHGIDATDVVSYTLRKCKDEKELNKLFDSAREADCHLVLTDPWLPGEDARLVLFPTDNPLAVIAATGTEGANYTVDNAAILDWAGKLQRENPFVLRYCSHDMLGGDFTSPLKRISHMAEKMVELCPPLLDDDFESAQALAKRLRKEKQFFMRWD